MNPIELIIEKHRQWHGPAAVAADFAWNLRRFGAPPEVVRRAAAQYREELVSELPFDEPGLRAYLAPLSRVELIDRYLGMFDSSDRAYPLLYVTEDEPADVFWSVMIETWNECDDIWPLGDMMLSTLRRRRAELSPIALLKAADRDFYNALPDRVTIYRGCGRRRIRSLPWTTDREQAAFLTKGVSFGTPPDPVIAEARIDKAEIFFVSTTCDESEVVVDPYRLGRVKVEPLAPNEIRRRSPMYGNAA